MTSTSDFQPALIRIQQQAPPPLGRAVLATCLIFVALLLVWGKYGQLDIVAVAEGKLVPATYLKIVQPAEQGIIKEILVKEGEAVKIGQILIRMDTVSNEADINTLKSQHDIRTLTQRRIDAELIDASLTREMDDPPELYRQIAAQYEANRNAYKNALASEQTVLDKARSDLEAAQEIRGKLIGILPHYQAQEAAYEKLAKVGNIAHIEYTDKQRERIEKEQDLKAQEHLIASAQATIDQSRKKLEQIHADYIQKLQNERIDNAIELEKLKQTLAKEQHRHDTLELKAPQNGTIKDLATHTIGTVTSPGTVLMTLVPHNETLRAEVWINNDDIGFIRPEQPVKIKLAAFRFQKYGMINGTVYQVSADANEPASPKTDMEGNASASGNTPRSLAYRTLINLNSQTLTSDGNIYSLVSGMQVSAEIKLGTRNVLEYLLSPVTKAFQEAGRER